MSSLNRHDGGMSIRKQGNGRDEYDSDARATLETAWSGLKRILSVPLGTLTAFVLVAAFVYGAWLAHDRLISTQSLHQAQSDERIQRLEKHDEEHARSDSATAAALMRIEQKIDDLKERVQRAEDRK